MKNSTRYFFAILFAVSVFIYPSGNFLSKAAASSLIQPSDISYLGAFKLPSVNDGSYGVFEYSNAPIAFYPSGDPGGSSDGYSGSLFVGGHVYATKVAEGGIPKPIISKNLSDLPTATLLQPFKDVTAGISNKTGFIMGMTYIPSDGKIYFTQGQDYSDSQSDCSLPGNAPGLGRFSPNLSNPQTNGLWYVSLNGSNLHPFTSTRYIMEIPKSFADANLGGKYVATGRHRGWCDREGTNLYASNTATAAGESISGSKLMEFGPFLDQSKWSKQHSTANAYQGGAWLTLGDKAAVAISGIIDNNPAKSYYGYENWTVPNACEPSGTCKGQRGWRAGEPQAAMLFYDPKDMADVANGTKSSWIPQWYAKFDMTPYFLRNYAPTFLTTGSGAEVVLMTFDRNNSLLYVSESFANGLTPIIHVFKISSSGTSPTPAPTPTVIPPIFKGDINNDHIVNSLDWSIMNSRWFTNDSTVDLNEDGIVNSLDFSIMNGNWLKSG